MVPNKFADLVLRLHRQSFGDQSLPNAGQTVGLAYARVNDPKQEKNYSIPTQLEACFQLACERRVFIPIELVFIDIHTGVEMWERDAFVAALTKIRARDATVFVVYDIDRFTREHQHQIIGEFLVEQAHGEVLYVQAQDASEEGQIMRQVKAIAAKIEWGKIKERTTRGKRARLEAGLPCINGVPPYGFGYAVDEKGRKTGFVRDPEKWEVCHGYIRPWALQGLPPGSHWGTAL